MAEGVAERLGVPCVSREIIAAAAESAGIPVGTLDKSLDRPPSIFERMSRERDTYLVFVRAALHRHAAQGSFVYHGHDGHLLLDLPNVLRVRVVAPLTYRVAAVQGALDLNKRDAERHIAKIDKHRAKWTKILYGVAWNDPLLYDLIVNLEKVDEAGAAAGVVTLRGSARDDELRRLVTETARRAEAAREVRCEVTIPADLLRG